MARHCDFEGCPMYTGPECELECPYEDGEYNAHLFRACDCCGGEIPITEMGAIIKIRRVQAQETYYKVFCPRCFKDLIHFDRTLSYKK